MKYDQIGHYLNLSLIRALFVLYVGPVWKSFVSVVMKFAPYSNPAFIKDAYSI